MKIIFTICSNNYLAQAKALGDSLVKTNPDYQFFIGLVDAVSSEINYETEIGHPIILCKDINIPDFDSLWKKYDIIELNTCVKPFFLKYFTQQYSNLEYIMYFDPDTYVYANLSVIENELIGNYEILLTPHISSPIPLDGKSPGENTFLNYGIYNLGFIAIKNPENNSTFFNWWSERTFKVGFNKVSEGFFVDQLWINLIPLYYKNVLISYNSGLNMAPWNLHERFLTKKEDDNFVVNKKMNLIFYHFSNYIYTAPDVLANYYDRYTFSDRKDLVELYGDYLGKIIKNDIQKFSGIKCKYVELRQEFLGNQELYKSSDNIKQSFRSKVINKLVRILKSNE